MEIKDIVLNQAFTAAVEFQDSGSGNTVTYTVTKVSDGNLFASGSASWVGGGIWKLSFTPTTDGETYLVKVTNSTLDVIRSLAFRATQRPQIAVVEVSGTTNEAMLESVNQAIMQILASGGVAMYSVGGKTVQRMSLGELRSFRDRLLREIKSADSSNPQSSYATFEDF